MRIRTGFSFHTAVGHLHDVVSRCRDVGFTIVPITDTDSTFGFRRFRDLCIKNDLKPAYGVELGVVSRLGEKKPIINYCTFLAKNDIRDINTLVQASTTSNSKEPALLFDFSLSKKNVIRIMGERTTFDQLRDIAAAPDTYLALSPSTPKKLVQTALDQNVGVKLIATSDNYYSHPDDIEFYRLTLGKRSNTQTYPMHILSDEEWFESVRYKLSPEQAQDAINNRNQVLGQLNAQLVNATLYQPPREKTLNEMCIEGAKRVGVDLNDPVYSERLERELKIIKEKEFEDYFYIVSDIVNWAKDKMLVGPGRGSSGGSLVCFLLDITTVDPIKNGLIFERFIDINRSELPDIDIDFSDERRELVFDYMKEKFGSKHVARLGSIGMFKPRSAMKQAASILRIPEWRVEKVLENTVEDDEFDTIIEETLRSTDAGKELLKSFPNIIEAARIENHPNVSSQHAAGMLVTQEPIVNYVAIDERSGSAMIDKKDAEALNLLKIDALGLTQLSVFERCLQLIGVTDIRGWFEKLPLDDPKAFAILNDQKFSGIFQFMGNALQGLCKQVNVESLEDIVSITALARPGPMGSGGAEAWARRRTGQEEITTPHPLMTELTKDTYGTLIYQEQIMQIVRQIGGMSWNDTSEVRKAIGKSMGADALEKYYEKFKDGAIKNGVEEYIARKIWNDILTFGRYGFNRSHAVAYGIVSYYCCYLKAYHPIEFCAATLDAEKDPMKQIRMLRELEEEGVGYIPFDIDKSMDRWGVTDVDGRKTLVGPLTSVKGIGPSAVIEVMGCRNSGEEIRYALRKRLEKAETEIDSIYPVRDAIKKLYPDLKDAGITTKPKLISEVDCGIEGEIVLIGVIKRMNIKNENDEASVARRGYKVKGYSTQSLNMFVMDDTDEILCKVDRFLFAETGKKIIDRGGAGKAIYAFKGTVPPKFRMLSVKRVIFLGMMGE